MAVVNVKRDPRRDSSSSGLSGVRRTLAWTVLVDSAEDTPEVAQFATGIPRKGDPYPGQFGGFLFAQEVRATHRGHLLFDVTVEYGVPDSTGKEGSGGGGDGENPLDEPAQISWSFESEEVPIDTDRDGNPIENSAKQGFDPPVTRRVSDDVLTVTQNVATVDMDQRRDFKDTVNATTFAGYPPGAGLLEQYDVEIIRVSPTFTYYRRTVRIRFRTVVIKIGGTETEFVGWSDRLLDQGWMEYHGTLADGKPDYRPISGSVGSHITQQVKLNGSGVRLDDGAAAVYIIVNKYQERNFNQLGLPI